MGWRGFLYTLQLFALLQTAGVYAAGTSSAGLNTSATSAQATKPKEFQDSQELTDARLRAENGSMRRYNMKAQLQYKGPVLSDFGSKDQPNPDGSVGSYATAISGKISGRYRLDKATSIAAGTGFKLLHPFHGAEKGNVNNPYMAYEMYRRAGRFQMKNAPMISAVTFPEVLAVGNFAVASFENALIYSLGGSRAALGFDTVLQYNMFSRPYRDSDKKSLNYMITLSPSFKYNFSDRISMTSSWGFSWWNLRRKTRVLALDSAVVTHRLGLGYAITRDVYIAPNLDMFPDRLSFASTTFNCSLIMSL